MGSGEAMAARRSSALLLIVACAFALSALHSAFVPSADASATEALRGTRYISEQDLAKVAAAGAAVAMPEAAHARLPEEFVVWAPVVDVLPILPFFFFLLAFLW